MVNQAAQTSDVTDADNEVSLDIEADINPVAAQQLKTLEDESIEQKTDATRIRLNRLKSTIRQIIFKQFDVPSLFALFCSRKPVGGKEMEFVNTDGSPITTCQIATESKDVVFGSIFDLDEINTLYNSYSLKFAHNMYVLPGLKTVRINGYLLNETPAGTIRSSQQEEAEVDALQRQLRKHYSDRRQVALHNEVRRLKKKWITNRSRPLTAVEEAQNKATYNEIQQAKIRRNAIYQMDKPFKVKSSDIHYHNGARKMMEKLQRAKNNSGRRILQIESEIAEKNQNEVYSADDLEIWNNEAKQHRDELRHFYYANARVRCHRAYELQKRKFIDRLCSNERRSMCKQPQNTSKKPRLVMFVGDRGSVHWLQD
ncbi:hypothetical protein BCV71DRAFT_268080 [Rhizopus microsporus]|uniref:Uncharacterized protein n=1 Tax=Rhizopus microsporus TaxID=58291 RepID=A0A1X0RP72_RHIZD|nr:hypothetical protein BCV71DRAFT_268080 [Rhizopus microsporus]